MTLPTLDEPIYLDGLAVGDVFISGEHRLDTEQVIAFASQFDPQPFHIAPRKEPRTAPSAVRLRADGMRWPSP